MLIYPAQFDRWRKRSGAARYVIVKLTDGTDTWLLGNCESNIDFTDGKIYNLLLDGIKIGGGIDIFEHTWSRCSMKLRFSNAPYKINTSHIKVRLSELIGNIDGHEVEIYFSCDPNVTALSQCLLMFKGFVNCVSSYDETSVTIDILDNGDILDTKLLGSAMNSLYVGSDYALPKTNNTEYVPIVYGVYDKILHGLAIAYKYSGLDFKYVVSQHHIYSIDGLYISVSEAAQIRANYFDPYPEGGDDAGHAEYATVNWSKTPNNQFSGKIEWFFNHVLEWPFDDTDLFLNDSDDLSHDTRQDTQFIVTRLAAYDKDRGGGSYIWGGRVAFEITDVTDFMDVIRGDSVTDVSLFFQHVEAHPNLPCDGDTLRPHIEVLCVTGTNLLNTSHQEVLDHIAAWSSLGDPFQKPWSPNNVECWLYSEDPKAWRAYSTSAKALGTTSLQNRNWGFVLEARAAYFDSKVSGANLSVAYSVDWLVKIGEMRLVTTHSFDPRKEDMNDTERNLYSRKVYVACKGLVFDTWISDSLWGEAHQGMPFVIGQVIEEPAMIVASLLCDEAGLDVSDLDYVSFCDAINTRLKARVNVITPDTVGDVIKDLLPQTTFRFYYTPVGKPRLIPLRHNIQDTPFSFTNIVWQDIKKDTISVGKTPIEKVVNHLTIKSHWEEEAQRFISEDVFQNTDSQTALGKVCKQTVECKNIDAEQGKFYNNPVKRIASHLIHYNKETGMQDVGLWSQQHRLLDFETFGMAHAGLETGDCITLDATSVDPHILCDGETWGEKYWLIYDIEHSEDGSTIKTVELWPLSMQLLMYEV